MSAQPPQLPFADQPGQGWSPEELAALGVIQEPKAEEKKEDAAPPAPQGPSMAEIQAMLNQQQAQSQQNNQLMIQQLLEANKPKPTAPKLPSDIPVRIDQDGKPVLSVQDLLPLVDNKVTSAVDGYHNQVIAPFVPAVEAQARDQKINNTIDFLKQNAPDLLNGRDPKQVASTVMAFYETSANPHQHRDDLRTQYAIEQAKTMFGNTGNPSLQQSRVSNQVGRTESGSTNQAPYAPGEAITIYRTTANEMGLDNFQRSIAAEADLHEYNAKNNMGWKITVKRPD